MGWSATASAFEYPCFGTVDELGNFGLDHQIASQFGFGSLVPLEDGLHPP
jgi:hypothetical protein|eukprot:COSAG01_NODE_33445_length_564_cov_0.572043_1_plen_50_part_00